MLSGENFQKFVRRRRLRNSDRSSILCAARSRGFAPAGYNRLSTGPELSFTRTLGGRHSLPKRYVRSARSVRCLRISNMISEQASAVGGTITPRQSSHGVEDQKGARLSIITR